MKHYSVQSVSEGSKKYFYIQDNEALEMVLLPTQYLTYKIRANLSPNTVKRSAVALCFYMEYMEEKQMEIDGVFALAYVDQNEHFIQFLQWLKGGRHKELNQGKEPRNGTCNAYLKEVFRFYLFLEEEHPGMGELKVFTYNQYITPNAVGVKRVIRSQSFRGYLKAEERDVRPAKQDEIITILQACTNCRDQVLILITAETGFRIGEILGVDYTRDINYQERTIRVYFRDDNDNDARAKNAECRRAKISKDTFEMLMHYMSVYRSLLQHQTFLFINIAGERIGQPMTAECVRDMFRRMEKKTGIKITPHMLRRYFAVTRWDADWALELISLALGHKHLDTTIKYLSVLDNKLMDASRKFYEQNSDIYGIEQLL